MAVRSHDPRRKQNALMRAMNSFAATGFGGWVAITVGRRVDPAVMRLTGGRVRVAPWMPTVVIEHTGAKTREPRTTPLQYFTDENRIVVIASKAGNPKHPAWYHNMKANPEVRASTDGNPEPYLAREAEGEERERLWGLATTLYPGYDRYQEKAGDRLIPVMVLEPK